MGTVSDEAVCLEGAGDTAKIQASAQTRAHIPVLPGRCSPGAITPWLSSGTLPMLLPVSEMITCFFLVEAYSVFQN